MQVKLPKLEAQVKFRPAGFWLRLLAAMIDGAIVNFFMMPLWLFYYIIYFFCMYLNMQSNNPLFAMIPMFVMFAIVYPALFLVNFAYYAWFNKKEGASLGKKLLKMRVVDAETGENLGYGKSFLREVIGKLFIGPMTLYIGFIIAGFRQDKQALHDIIAKTYVLRRID